MAHALTAGTGPNPRPRSTIQQTPAPLTLVDFVIEEVSRPVAPKLRVDIMHAGYPMMDDLLAVLYAHPQVYVDVGIIVYNQPRPAFTRGFRILPSFSGDSSGLPR